jgi:hypothetical protein
MSTMIRSALFSLLLCAFVSCSPQPKTDIIGKWQSLGPVGKGDIMEFTLDGKFVRTYLSEDNGEIIRGTTIRGRYRFVDSAQFELESDFADDIPIKTMKNVKLDPEVCGFKIREDILDLTNSDGTVEQLKRLH